MTNIKTKIANALRLYASAYKRPFDFEGEPQKGEYGNFVGITAFICISLFLLFLPLYQYRAIVLDTGMSPVTVKLYFGVALFWCFMVAAMFPLAGIVCRRFNSYNVDRKYIFNVLNSAIFRVFFWVFLIAVTILGIHFGANTIIPGILAVFINLHNFLFLGITIFAIYFALLVLGFFCYRLRKMDKLLKWKKTRVFWIALLFYASIASFLASFLPFTIHGFLSACIFSVLPLLLVVYLWRYLAKSENKYVQVFVPLGFMIIWLPFNIFNIQSRCNPLAIIYEPISGTNFVEQKVESIADKQLNALSLPLLKAVAAENPDKNILISAHNVYQGLGLLANGANAETLQKLQSLLGSNDLANINSKSNEVITHHSAALNFDNKLKMAASHLDDNFKRAAANIYNAKFSKPDKPCSIEYFSKIEFAAEWKTKFGKKLRNMTFYAPTGSVSVPMMFDTREVYIANGSNFRILALPYRTGDIFYIILPDSPGSYGSYGADGYIHPKNSVSLNEVLDTLTPEALDIPFEWHSLEIAIPKFKMTKGVKFKTALSALGLGDLFIRGQSGLDKILAPDAGNDTRCTPNNIFIDAFTQQNKIEVDENGTTAVSVQMAALNYATGGNINLPFIVDRPFIFMINNGAFIGIVNNPLETD